MGLVACKSNLLYFTFSARGLAADGVVVSGAYTIGVAVKSEP